MKILIACEESQTVCKAFREKGHEAYSCDVQDCSGGHPEWHIKGDVLEQLNKGWDMIIAHPPCTYLANSGVQWLHKDHSRWEKMRESAEFFKTILNAPVEKLVVENPIIHKYAKEIIGENYTQTIQPWQFGEDASKRTCLWLKGVEPLKPTKIIKKHRYANQSPCGANKLGPSPERAKLRSKTYKGIAKAMAEQWG